jgi:hypothetical protein
MSHAAVETKHFGKVQLGTTPAGHAVELLHTRKGAILSGATPDGAHLTMIVNGGGGGGAGTGGFAEFSIGGALGGLWDTVVEAAGKLKSLLSCTPVQTTTVNVGADGKITSVTISNSCVPS